MDRLTIGPQVATLPHNLFGWGVVGQIGNLRPIVNRPCAGPLECFGRRDEAGVYRIHLDIVRDSFELLFIPHQAIVTFILPERLASESKYKIGFSCCESFEGLRQFRDRKVRCDQEVDVVGHDDVVMQFVSSTISVEDGLDHQVGNFGSLKVQRTRTPIVEQAIHGDEGFS